MYVKFGCLVSRLDLVVQQDLTGCAAGLDDDGTTTGALQNRPIATFRLLRLYRFLKAVQVAIFVASGPWEL